MTNNTLILSKTSITLMLLNKLYGYSSKKI